MAFETFDSDGDGGLTRRELWRFLRSFLATVLNFATRREVNGVASSSSWDGVIVEAVAAVFKEIPQAQDGVLRSTVTFDDFGAWYNEQGSEKLPWLELLDLRKWPEVTSDADARNNGDDTAMNPEVDDLSTATDEAPSFNEDDQDYDDDDQDFDYEAELKAFQAARARGDFDAALNHVTPSLAPPAPSTTTSSRPLLPPSSMFADEEDEAASAAEKESALMLERRRSADDVERKRREGESVPLFSTPLNTFGDWLEVRDVDVEHMRRIVGSTRLLAMEPLELAGVIVQALRSADPTAAGSDGASQTNVRRNIWNVPLRDSDFLAILEELVPESMLDEEVELMNEKEEGEEEEEGENVRFAEEALAIVFAGLGSSSSRRCTASELIAGLTVLCVGDKSDKLAVAFDAFDVGGRGCMDKMQMVSFLRSFLSVLLSLTVGIRHRDLESEDEMSSLALTSEVTAVELAERIFSDLGLDDGDGGSVEFDQFAEWYTKQGYEILQWLELLDRRKWPGQPQFEFALAGVGGERDVAARLRVYPEDATLLQNLLRATNFGRVGITEILDVVRAVASGGKVTQSDFNRCVRTFVGGPMTNRDDISLVSGVLSSIFNIMDRDDTRSIHVDDAVGALALFSSGSKSDKLATVFDAFDVDRLGWLTKRQLWRYLRSFLSSIASLCGGGSGVTDGSGGAASSASSSSSLSASSIDNACVALTDRIFEDADLHDDEDRITFEEFADWYTYTGFEYAPWLELLDQKKWFVGGEVVEMAEESEMSEDSEMTEESETEDEESYTEEMNDSLDATAANDAFGLLDTDDDDDEPLGDQSLVVVGTAMPIRSSPSPAAATTNDDDDDDDDDDDVLLECLEYKLSESVTNSNLSIGPKGCDTLAFFLELSQLGTIPAPFVRASVFSVCDDTTRCLDERTFRATMRNLVSASRGECGLRPANLEEMSFVDALMTKIFNAFDDDGLSEGAMADELACGASLFASGSKSEKLAECFDMFDQNGTGDLGRITFSRYLLSI